MDTAERYWAGIHDVDQIEVVTVPEGESGLEAARERLTAERLDAIALYLATPEEIRRAWDGPKDPVELALRLGFKLKNFPRWQAHPAMVKRVTQYLNAAILYAMPTIAWGQAILASPEIEQLEDGSYRVIPGDTKAANFCATIARMIRQPSAGASATFHNNNVVPSPASEMGAARFSEEDLDDRIDARVKEITVRREEHGPEGGEDV